MFSFDGSGKSQRRLDEVQREDAHVSIKAVLGHLQGSAARTRHQLLFLQYEDVVGLLAGLEGVKSQDVSYLNWKTADLRREQAYMHFIETASQEMCLFIKMFLMFFKNQNRMIPMLF